MTRNSIHWQRLEAALAGEKHDATPVSLWKHYHLVDRAPGKLASGPTSYIGSLNLTW